MGVRRLEITARTGLVGVLGHPISHSLSPIMHNAAFQAQGVDMVYLAFDVVPGRLAEAVAGMRALNMKGANVTIPHKQAVAALLDVVDPLAARVGAVNTIVNEQGRLIGFNTDVAGFLAALRSVRAAGGQGLRCLVAGAGGAARAVVAGLAEDGATEIWVYNRTEARAISLCESAAEWGRPRCEAVSAAGLRDRVRNADLVVNATSVGLEPSVKETAFPVDILSSSQIVMDLVYGPRPTSLVAGAAASGATALDGREMLLMQAASSYRLWTGAEPPVEAMRKSLDGEER
jgi:shikimate dehydrogenase